jgi:signal transduction histidine kinase
MQRAQPATAWVSEERLHLARELHDVVAHTISVINVQASTALHLMDCHPDRARSALVTINDASRQALADVRSVLGVLRGASDHPPPGPAVGLERLDELVATSHAAGLAVQVTETGQRRPLPAGTDLAGYRIIQEALTNSARHSSSGSVAVRIDYTGPGLLIEVDDDGPARAAGCVHAGRVAGGGTGIIGMTERARALGGTLDAGPRPGGGFRVRARLPVPEMP